MPVEIELKLAVAPGDVARLRRHPLLKALKAGRSRLYGVYFDTPEFDLYQRRSAFRLRREGYHWVQTVKLDRGSVGGLSMRPEYEVRVAGNQPDFAILPMEARAALTREVEDRLAPAFVTDFQRTVWDVERPRGTVEIALDSGHIRAGEADLPVAELELELVSGDSAVLFEIARELLDAAPLVSEYRSKALRGYGLLGVWREKPGKAVDAEVNKRLPAAEAWRRALLSGLDQLGRNLPGLLAGDDPEYLHQARVAVRRLRTMLGLGRTLGLDREAWVEALRWFMAELSPARDWDVFVTETLAGVHAALPEPERLDGLLVRAGKVRTAANRRARAAVRDRRLTNLMLDMGEALLVAHDDGPPLAEWAGQALDKRWRRFRKLAGRFGELDAAGRHQTRIAAKRLRYAGEAFAVLYGAREGRYLARLADLQDVLGVANDVAVAHRLLAELNRDGREAYAVGLVEGYIAARAEAHLSELIGRTAAMVKARPFWR
ncbi:MAG: CHAD domain-containing protein [Thiobacillus sp.]|nr:CHAD domain-containing protein [Thiobacillus sp.]